MSSNTQKTEQAPQTENHLGSTIVKFVVMMALFLAAVYSLNFLTLGNPWPMAVCLVLFALSFWIPQTILGRSDSAGES
jgi:ABC-type xylose transport system permease subunit